MKQSKNDMFLEESLHLLIRHFGIEKIRLSLKRLGQNLNPSNAVALPKTGRRKNPLSFVDNALASIEETDAKRHGLLKTFYERLKSRSILHEVQDIKQFAQLAGLKKIEGKSRRDLLAPLMNFLIEVPLDRIEALLQSAETISDRERQRGFSILTDKLLGGK